MNTTGWGRRRLLGILAAAIVAALVLVVGLGYAVVQVVAPAGTEGAPADVPGVARGDGLPPSSATGQGLRDEIAAAPMLSVPKEAMEQSEKATDAAPVLSVPSGTGLGAANVLTGFPQTPQGAAGQLAQLEITVLQAMSLGTTQQVYDAWAMPGGPGVGGWGLTRAVGAFLDSTGMVEAKDPTISVRVQPVGALIKGTDGADWVTACVLTRVSASFREQGEVAYGYCERMQWRHGRWMIAPGAPPAPAPATWPGTRLANDAGWRTWVSEIPTPDSIVDPAVPGFSGAGDLATDATDVTDDRPAATPVVAQVGVATGGLAGARVVAPAGAAVGFGIIPGLPDPLGKLGKIIAKAAADGWTTAMLAMWQGGLSMLKLALVVGDNLLTPDLSENGPGHAVYEIAFWIAGALAGLMMLLQLGVAAFKRDGKSLARVLVGGAQFVVVCAAWISYCVTLLAACSGLSKALMKVLLGVTTFGEWDPLGGFEADDITDAAIATVLGFLGMFVFLAAIGHVLIMLGRGAALMVLAATGPIAAAGLTSDAGSSWFWKSLRWFHAAALTPPLMVLVLGVGVQFSTGAANGMADSSLKAIGTALPGLMLLFVSCVAPMGLFKLLAFVDPGTASGASFRQGMSASGGLQGLLSGNGGGAAAAGSAAAAQTDGHGRSSGEAGAESSTNDRFSQAAQKGLSTFGGGAGKVAAAGIGIVQKAGAAATSLMSDVTNQAGVGHHTYAPDFSSLNSNSNGSGRGPSTPPHPHEGRGGGGGDGEGGEGGGEGGGDGSDPSGPPPEPPPMTPTTSPAMSPATPPGIPDGGDMPGSTAPPAQPAPPVPPAGPEAGVSASPPDRDWTRQQGA